MGLMLTYRTGAVGATAGGQAMAAHLLEQTLPTEAADLARYYQDGVDALSPEERELRTLAKGINDRWCSYEGAAEYLYIKHHNKLTADAQPADEIGRMAQGHGRMLVEGEITIDEVRAEWYEAIGQHMVAGSASDEAFWAAEAWYTTRVDHEAMACETRHAQAEQHATETLNAAIEAFQRGTGEPTAAQPRRDMHPALARLLRIDPNRSVSTDELASLLAGKRADGEAIEGASKRKTVSFVDMTFSADKSVSLAWAFARTDAERNQVVQAHRDAVSSTMKYVSAELGRARKGAGGRDGFDGGHIGWVSFDHYTSRPTLEIAKDGVTELIRLKVAGDANLHTHVATLNVVLTDAGRVGSLDLQRLEGRVHEFGAYYQAHLAQNFRALGADVALDQETGAARLTAIPDRVRTAFSKRATDATTIVRRWARENGQDWDALPAEERIELAKRGAQVGRMAKEVRRDDMSDFSAWREQADALGWKHEGALPPTPPQLAPQSHAERTDVAYHAALPFIEKAFARAAVVDAAEIRVAATRGLIAASVTGPEDINAVVRALRDRGVRQDGQDTRLIVARDGPTVRITTEAHVGQEEELVALAKAAAADRSGALSQAAIAQAIERSSLDLSTDHGRKQREVIERLGTGGRLGVAIGAAGVGKTALMEPLVAAWQADGRTVHGAAVAWRQADDLAEAGIAPDKRLALSVLLDRAEAGKLTLGRQSVVVVDELGLVGTPDMARLLRIQAASDAQVVAVGDPLQCQAISAGPVIDLMRKALGPDQVPELLTTVRQQTERERETSLLFRNGQANEALRRKREDGTVEIVPGGYREAVERTADLWAARRQANAYDPRYSLTVTAPTNEDARAIAGAIRERRRAAGEVGPDRTFLKATDQNGVAYDLPLARGDRVRLFANTTASLPSRAPGGACIGRNGSVVEVLDVAADGVRLRNARGTEGLVKWSTLADPQTGRVRLTYGDCLTINSAQGVTSVEHIDAMPGGSRTVNAYTAYVAESRHRRQSWLVTSDGAERQEVVARRPLGDARPIKPSDVVANIARNLERQPEKPSALLFLERAAEALRVGARGLQSGSRPAEERQRAGQEPTTLHHAFQQHRRRERFQAISDQLQRIKPAVEAVIAKVREHKQHKIRVG